MSGLFITYTSINLIIFIFGVVRFKKHTTAFKLLITMVGVMIVNDCLEELLAINRHSNMPVYHIYNPIEYLFYTSIYRQFFTGSLKKAITIAIVPILLFSIINSIYIQKINRYPSNILLLNQFVYIVYSLLGFREMLLHPGTLSIFKQSFFWLNLALILFSTTLFMYFGLVNYSQKHHINIYILDVLDYIVNIIYMILMAIAIFNDKKPQVSLKLNELH